MTARMSMRERREKIETLVQNDPRVQACAREFDESLSTITGWHAHNDALCATKAELYALADLITFNEFCLEDLKCAKTAAYNQLMSQYPRVWDTTCDDPFFYTTAQTTAPGDGVEHEETATLPETEEMSAVPDRDVHKFADADEVVLHTTSHNPALRDWIEGLDHDTVRGIRITAYNPLQGGCHDVDPASLPEDFLDYLTNAAHAAHHDMGVDASQYVPVAVVRSILDRWQTHYEQFRDFCTAYSLSGPVASGALTAIKRIRTEIDQLTTPTEETNNA